MHKILQVKLQQYKNLELPDVQAVFRKGRGTRDQTANIHWIIEKAREFQGKKKSTSASLTMPKSLTLWITTNCGKFFFFFFFFEEMGIPDYLTCLLRNLYVVQEATARNRRETMGWFQLRKGVCLGCILSPCLFNLHAE